MKIETKFNIGDSVYYEDSSSFDKGKIDDIIIHFWLDTYYINYKVDKDFYTSFKNRSNELRYQEFAEGRLHSSEAHFLKEEIVRAEKHIESLNEKIDELKIKLKSLPE